MQNNIIKNVHQEPNNFITKKIGATVYKIRIHYPGDATKSVKDKLLRIIKMEAAKGGEVC